MRYITLFLTSLIAFASPLNAQPAKKGLLRDRSLIHGMGFLDSINLEKMDRKFKRILAVMVLIEGSVSSFPV